ncbi:MAG: hypothetical protein PVJ43_03995 [Gemmatimonadales bacterium]|jgi:hypothetical protein
MTQLPSAIELGLEDEARRLWNGALAARKGGATDLVSLLESLDLGLHAAEILVIQLLQPIKDSFPATIGLLLNTPAPEVDLRQDAINVPKALGFTDAIDLLSADDLECVSPGMHRGWEDRRFSCRRSRTATREAVGITLTAEDQEQLLLLAAYRNRLFRCPPPVRVVPGEILNAFDRLESLINGLLTAAEPA